MFVLKLLALIALLTYIPRNFDELTSGFTENKTDNLMPLYQPTCSH